MPPARIVLLSAALALAAGCGDDDDGDAATATTAAAEVGAAAGCQEEYAGITVCGEVGVDAEVTLEDAAPSDELVAVDLVPGDGAEATPGATVTVHYRGLLFDGTEFDASFGGQPATFPLDGVIQGWSEGIPGMQVGGRRLLVIPAALAYGAQGFPPVIGPDEPLIFVVDLLDAG